MIRRPLGSFPEAISVIGLGALHFGAFLTKMESIRLIDYALDKGVNLIDTAPIYGHAYSETIVGEAIRHKRQSFIVATKVGLEKCEREDGSFGVAPYPLCPDRIRDSIEDSLQALKIDVIDILQLHSFDPTIDPDYLIEALDRLREEGKIRAWGCSNHSPDELASMLMANGSSPCSCQAHFNFIERRAGNSLAPICSEYGVGMIVNRALARGILSGRYKSGKRPPAGSRGALSNRVAKWLEPAVLDTIGHLKEIAADTGRTATEISLAWVLAQPAVSVALVGARSISQLRGCLGAGSQPLEPEVKVVLENLIDQVGLTYQVNSRPVDYLEI